MRKFTEAEENRILRAYAAGKSLRTIGESNDTSTNTIRRTLLKKKAKLRPRGRPVEKKKGGKKK